MHYGVGVEAFARRDWPEAYGALDAAARASELEGPDMERLGLVAALLGRDEESDRAWEQAHQTFLAADDAAAAARCAFWLSMGFMQRGEMAHAGGWLARAERILDEAALDCPERGYVRIPRGLQLLDEGDALGARDLFDDVRALGKRFADTDLITLGCLGSGQALIRQGDIAHGAARLDEAMVSVLANEVSPVVAGIVYCAVVETCQEMFDLRRAREWTDALTQWCDSQPGLVPFRGQCQIYRAEVMQLRGNWQDALQAAFDAERRLSGPPMHPAVGAACYLQGELHRLRGAVSDADEAFRRAEECGRRPEPGRALLRLAQGRTAAAVTAIRHALDESRDDASRAPLLASAVEIFTAVDDATAAREAADELERLSAVFNVPWLNASAAQAQGMVAMAAGDAAGALPRLRAAFLDWQSLDAPYETARTRALLARAATLLGDPETAGAHLEAARRTFQALGAAAELRHVAGSGESDDAATYGLTPREVEVLRLVTRGLTNRAIAASLTISEKTVANHVGNILGKLGLSSRAAATAYAYEHRLV